MSTLRVSNIEAKADASSPSVNEKVKVTNSSGDVLIHVNGETTGIATVGVNTTGKTFDVDTNQNVSFTNSIGIGTDIPSTRLDVEGSNVPVAINSSNSNTYKIQLENAGSTVAYIGAASNEVYFANASAAEQARFTDSGLKLPSGKGIDFSAAAGSASGSTSALLDDYEEGTFVPIARGRTTAGTTTYSRTAVGKYVKIGRLVNVMVDMVFSSATGTGNLEIAGLPFAAHTGPYVRFAGSVTLLNAGISWSNQIAPYINDTLSHFWITNTPTSGNYTFVDINSSTTEILLNCTYMVD